MSNNSLPLVRSLTDRYIEKNWRVQGKQQTRGFGK
jgi:hypothetical protein